MFYVDWLEVETSLDLAIISNGSMRERFTFIIITKVASDTNILDLRIRIQNQIRLVLLFLTDTKIRYHYGKMVNFVSPNQIQIQIGLVLFVRPDTRDDTSQP